MFRKLRLLASCISMSVAVTTGGLALAQGPGGPQAPAAPAPMAPATPQAPAAPAPMAPVAPAPMAPATPQAPVAPALQPAAPVTTAFEVAPCCNTGCDTGDCCGRGHHGCVFTPQIIGDGLNFVSGAAPPGTTLIAPLAPGHLPVALDGAAFKIADNESARPDDRVFAHMQYFAGVLANDHPPTAVFLPRIRYAVEVMGFEKTFLDGDASIGLRVPFFQIHSENGAIDNSDAGDVTMIAKFALVNTECSVLSAGMAFTFPTGPDSTTTIVNGAGKAVTVAYDPFIWQPFVGFVRNSGDFYVQGFSSLAIPFSDTVGWDWFNDIALGWYAYRGECSLNALVPTAELHIATPFGHQGSQGFPVGEIDTWTVTLGAHMVFRDHAVFSLGWNFALSGPQPYTGGMLAQFNYHF